MKIAPTSAAIPMTAKVTLSLRVRRPDESSDGRRLLDQGRRNPGAVGLVLRQAFRLYLGGRCIASLAGGSQEAKGVGNHKKRCAGIGKDSEPERGVAKQGEHEKDGFYRE